jgi:hypothetical protein
VEPAQNQYQSIVSKDRAANRSYADRAVFQAHLVDHFRDQAMCRAVRAARAVVGADIGQRIRSGVNHCFHFICHHHGYLLILLRYSAQPAVRGVAFDGQRPFDKAFDFTHASSGKTQTPPSAIEFHWNLAVGCYEHVFQHLAAFISSTSMPSTRFDSSSNTIAWKALTVIGRINPTGILQRVQPDC